MARTRTEIKALAVLNTGRSDKDTLMSSLCDSALKIAVTKHPFANSKYICDDLTITEDATSVSIASLEQGSVAITFDVIDILTARIVQTDGTLNKLLSIKNQQWWDRNVVNPEDNAKGWPDYGLHFGTNIILNRPANDGMALRLRISATPTFASDATECPIKILDVFIEQYATAMTYLSLGMNDKYVSWYIMALGRNYDKGEVGGTLLNCIQQDRSESAEDKYVERGSYPVRDNGIAVENNITGAPNFGNTVSWY